MFLKFGLGNIRTAISGERGTILFTIVLSKLEVSNPIGKSLVKNGQSLCLLTIISQKEFPQIDM